MPVASLFRSGVFLLLAFITQTGTDSLAAVGSVFTDFSNRDRSTSVEMTRISNQADAYAKIRLVPDAKGSDLRRSVTFLDLSGDDVLSQQPVTLKFRLGFEEGFPAEGDYVHIFDAPRFAYSIGPDQTWGMSVVPSGKLVLWNGDGAGKVSSVDTGIRVQNGVIYHFTVEVIPQRQEWAVTVEYADTSDQFHNLGFRSAAEELGGVVHFATLLTADNTERTFYLSPVEIISGVSEFMLDPPAENLIRNADLSGGEHLQDNLFWHRMRNVEYVELEETAGLQLVSDAEAHGQRAVKIAAGSSLKVPAEVWKPLPGQPWTFSVYLKADRDDVQCELQVESYRHHDLETRSKVVTVGREWQRFELQVADLHRNVRRSGRTQGPMTFSIKAKSKDASLWVDGLQWENHNEAKRFSVSRRAEDLVQTEVTLPVLPPLAQAGVVASSAERDLESQGSIAITAYNETVVKLKNAPVALSIPFPSGAWFGNGTGVVRTDDQVMDTQTRIVSRWPQDHSVLAVEVSFLADLDPGESQFAFEYDGAGATSAPRGQSPVEGALTTEILFEDHQLRVVLDETSGLGWSQVEDADSATALFGSSEVIAIGADGTRYSSRFSEEIQFEVERKGDVRTSLVKRGFLTSETQGDPLLMFTLRLDFWKGRAGADIEVTLTNRFTSDSVALREVYWQTKVNDLSVQQGVQTPWGEAAALEGDIGLLQSYRYQPGQWSQALVKNGEVVELKDHSRGAVWLGFAAGGKAFHFQVERAWQQHPSMLALSEDGVLKGYLWPARPVIGLEFSPGMSITRNFRLFERDVDLSAEQAAIWADTELSGRADPEWVGRSGLFHGVPAADIARFPVLEGRFTSPENLDRLSPDRVESDHLYGLFDYGDHPGDGGWANLESYHDFSVIVRGFRSTDLNILEQGLASARHYRDVDINQNRGMPIVHSANHVIGGSGFGHAWSQGVLAHYLLTGSERSREVLQLHGEAILALPVDNREVEEGRNLGYYLLTLADFYELTGDQRYVDRFMQQIEHSKTVLLRNPTQRDLLMQRTDQARDSSFFYWQSSGIVPFALWYGLAGLLKMYDLTEDPALLPHIEREFAISMDFDLTYRYHLKELWPGLPVEETFPLMALEYANGRGSYLFPVLRQYARMFDQPQWIDFGALGVYALALNGGDRIENVLGAAILAELPTDLTEDVLIDAARDLMWNAAADELLNGDFSDYSQYDTMLTEVAGYGMTPTFAKEWLTPHHWRLQMGKELTATGSMRFRQDMADLDFDEYGQSKPSMRLNLSRKYAYTNRISLDSARFKLEPGMYELSLAMKQDDGVDSVQFGVVVSDFSGRREVFRAYPSPSGAVNVNDIAAISPFSVASRDLPGKEGWCQITIRFVVEDPLVANFFCIAGIERGREQGYLWLDDVSVRPYKQKG